MRLINQFLKDKSKCGENRRLGFVLFLGLINGLIFTFLVPPWQHYDEPLHFEYVWLIWDRHALPQPGDYDQEMRRATASSMLEHGFYDGLSIHPDLNAVDSPIWIGNAPQLENPPLHYIIAAVPSVLLDIEDVTKQLYAARLSSLLLYLLTIVAAWGVVVEFTRLGHPVRLYLPLTLALLPGFTDSMTAVNNDAAAVAFVSLALWGSLYIVKHGFSTPVTLGTVIAVIASYYSKEVAIVTLPVLVVALFFSIFRNRLQWLPWVVISVGGIGVAMFLIVMDDAALWYRSTSQAEPVRLIHGQAPLGNYVFKLDASRDITPRWMVPLFQPVPKQSITGLENAKFVMGAWIWADTPATIHTPMIGDGYRYYSKQIQVTAEPTYYVFSVEIKNLAAKRLWVSLDPRKGKQSRDLDVYYDGLILTYDVSNPIGTPDFDDASGDRGSWNGEEFTNLLRNGSAEYTGIRIGSSFDNIITKFLPARASLLVTSMLDPSGAGWIFQASGIRIFRTFWGKFGWGNVPLVGHKPYRNLAVFAAIAVIGFVFWFSRLLSKKKLGRYASYMLVLFLLFVFVWFGVITRASPHLGVIQMYVPVARYAAPAIIPTLLIITIGWLEILRIIIRWLKVSPNLQEPIRFVVYFGVLFLFDCYSLLSIYSFYHGG